MKQKDWGSYYENIKAKPVAPLLIQAVSHVESRGKALDMGAGTLKDSVYLLEGGFEVTAIDMSPHIDTFAAQINHEKLSAHSISFEEFPFGENTYDVISAQYALPFIKKENFHEVFSKVKASLKTGGVFCGQFFGTKDEWVSNQRMSFHTRAEVEAELEGLDILLLGEIERDGKKADGTPKHWHFFNVIAKKT